MAVCDRLFTVGLFWRFILMQWLKKRFCPDRDSGEIIDLDDLAEQIMKEEEK